MRWSQVFLVLLFVALFFEILIGFPTSLEKPEPIPSTTEGLQKDKAEKKFEGVHVVETQEGRKDWELFSDQAESFETQSLWKLQTVKVLLFSDNELQFTVVGDSGQVNTQTKDIDIRGNVVTTSSNGYRYQSRSVQYTAAQRKLSTSDPVQMQSPEDSEGIRMHVNAVGMESWVDQKKMLLQKAVKARRKMPKSPDLSIASSRAEFSTTHHSASFSGDVVVRQGDLKIEGPELEMKVKPGTDLLQSVLLRGGVKIMDSEKYAQSERLIFDPVSNQFTLLGKPRVVQDQDEILGDEIVLLDGGRKIKVEKIRAHVEKLQDESPN